MLYAKEDSVYVATLFMPVYIERRSSLETNSELLTEALEYFSLTTDSQHLEILLLWQTSLLHGLAINRLDMRPCIYSLRNVFSEEPCEIFNVNCFLLMISRTIDVCSSVYLLDLLQELLSFKELDLYILETLKASLLQWLVAPSILTAQANELANNILLYIENFKPMNIEERQSFRKYSEEFCKRHETIISANSEVFLYCQICLLLGHFSEEDNILRWLERLQNAPLSFIRSIYHFLCARIYQKKAFSILLNYIEHNKLLSSQLLTLILYKLSETKDSQLHFALLKALPKMVVLKENIPKVIVTIQAISIGTTDLYNFGLSLMFEAWKVEPKCYSYLENMLVRYNFPEKKWESYVTKAYTLKELCERKPELYGKEMVAHLSKVLNDYNTDDGSLPCALAIDGITALCRAEVIDAVTTWTALWPKFINDRRVPVIKSLCGLIHEIPTLPYTESYTTLIEEVVQVLWNYVDFGDPQISEVALYSLTSFPFERICAQMPEKYLDENVVQERMRSGIGVPQTVPGNTWIKFLQENNASAAASNFIIKMISIEVKNYLKYVYQVKGSKEPLNYGYLPTHSIVRGLGDFVRTQWKKIIHDAVYIECLKILSKEYSKPLPPLDWCFLQELIHEPRLKGYCIDIACHQAILSGTARRLAENYIVAVTENPQENEITIVMKNLKHLANSIQPMILKPFFEKSIEFAVIKYNEVHEDRLLKEISQCFIEVLSNKDIQEINKTTIAQMLNDYVSVTDIRCKLFEIFLQTAAALPEKCIKEISHLKDNVSAERLEKVRKIRTAAAIHTNTSPLIWLNEVIEAGSTMQESTEIFSDIQKVFRKHIHNSAECALWLLDLIGQIQAKVADRCDEKIIIYFCDVLILTVIEFSGYSTFIIEENEKCNLKMKQLFPQAFNALLNIEHWNICTSQALEWLYHMNTGETIPADYRNLFGLTLQALRHDDEFTKNLRWMKYLSSRVIHNFS
ncbi:hypothetical protein NQ317_009334 [Molorchus minor]|uniref:DUF3730 domain-containing protein n=1 Tax=Molorchus minor TaxID=1323400 RepID=A0ABQ9JGL0_9CUCU|nr:hypothetical protein NQ317_009334 [Molorchus minor]